MRAFIRRGFLPVVFIICGFASLIYGAKIHHLPVLVEHQTEVTVEVPMPFNPEMQPFSGNPQFQGPPQFRKETVKKTEWLTLDEFEPALIKEVTVGGIALNESRQLKRTYSGKAPSLCPT